MGKIKNKLLESMEPEVNPIYEDLCMVGDGWAKLLVPLFKIVNLYNILAEKPIEITQVKEKFGTLRFYTSEAPEWFETLVEGMEVLSAHTCENCGQYGILFVKNKWLKTLCDKCAAEAGYVKAKPMQFGKGDSDEDNS